jgi:hypothetical protein
MEAVNAQPIMLPPVRSEAAWSAAAERVERYLRALRLAGPKQVSRLAADIVGIAQAKQRPGVDPVTMAMETMDACMGAWFARLLPAGEAGGAQLLTRGRLALIMGEVPARGPAYFLRESAVPAELVRVMREADLGRAPEIRFSNMAPRPVAAPAAAISRLRWQLSYRWPFLRIVTGWMVVLSLLGATLAAGR